MVRNRRWRHTLFGSRTFPAGIVLTVAVWLCAAGSAAAQEVVRIGTLPGLRYDTRSFSVRPGGDVELVFSNADEMLHNLVITRPGARERVVQAALELGAGAADRNFVPASADVLWSTPLVQSGQSFTLRFTAPTTLGPYPFVCTMPGHGLIMFGTMMVTNSPGPVVRRPVDEPEPPAGGDEAHAGMPHAMVMRGFMPDSGPASISVELPGGVAYVYDAGAGRFRYAWTGTNPTMPSSPERGLARLNGEIFYREPAFPLRIGTSPDAAPTRVDFHGYTIDADGIPEFETSVDGATVRERAEVRDGAFVRRFRIEGATTVWFAAPEGSGLDVSGGTRDGAFYRLTGAAAREFTVRYTIPAGSAPVAAR